VLAMKKDAFLILPAISETILPPPPPTPMILILVFLTSNSGSLECFFAGGCTSEPVVSIALIFNTRSRIFEAILTKGGRAAIDFWTDFFVFLLRLIFFGLIFLLLTLFFGAGFMIIGLIFASRDY